MLCILNVHLLSEVTPDTLILNMIQLMWHLNETQKGTSRQRSGKGAIRKRFPLQNRGGKKHNNQALIPRKHTVSRMSSYFPIRWPLSYLSLIKKYENIHKAPTARKHTVSRMSSYFPIRWPLSYLSLIKKI